MDNQKLQKDKLHLINWIVQIQDHTLIEKIKGRPDEHLLQTVLLRSMQQAVYSPDNNGHFGLAYGLFPRPTLGMSLRMWMRQK